MKKLIFTIIISFMCLHFSFGQCYSICWDMYDIRTSKGSLVATLECCESHPSTREYLDNFYGSLFPNGRILTYDGYYSTGKFNCHGYAWIRVDQGIDRWLDPADKGAFVNDGSYVEVPSEIFPGKVSWTNTDHSGITTPDTGWIISKWLNGPLYRHRWDDSYYGSPPLTPLKYYVRNCDNTGTLIINLENQTITTNQIHIACSINVKNITVSNNSKLILDAENEFNIIGEFEIGVGSELEIW